MIHSAMIHSAPSNPAMNPSIPPILSICIPTHHGRHQMLRELIASILMQAGSCDLSRIEICISDNGSNDSTRTFCEQLAQTVQTPSIRYHRFEANQGLKNFTHVVSMACAPFCWMVGSDDIIPSGTLSKVIDLVEKNPDACGFTLNKFNLNPDLS